MCIRVNKKIFVLYCVMLLVISNSSIIAERYVIEPADTTVASFECVYDDTTQRIECYDKDHSESFLINKPKVFGEQFVKFGTFKRGNQEFTVVVDTTSTVSPNTEELDHAVLSEEGQQEQQGNE